MAFRGNKNDKPWSRLDYINRKDESQIQSERWAKGKGDGAAAVESYHEFQYKWHVSMNLLWCFYRHLPFVIFAREGAERVPGWEEWCKTEESRLPSLYGPVYILPSVGNPPEY